MLPTPAEKLQNFFGVFLQFHIGVDNFDPSNFNFQITLETPFETRYFIVELTAQKEIRSVVLDHIAALDRQTVVDTISRIIDTNAERGYV